jgi:hypothetical protein
MGPRFKPLALPVLNGTARTAAAAVVVAQGQTTRLELAVYTAAVGEAECRQFSGTVALARRASSF